MEGKKKIIIMGIIGIIVSLSLIINLSAYSARKSMERERANLQKENSSLSRKITESERLIKQLEEKLGLLNNNINTITQERDDMQGRYGLLEKERADLIEKLKAKEAEKPPLQEIPVAPPSDDTYWGEILKQKTKLELQLANIRNELKSIQESNEQLQKDNRKLTYNQQVLDSIAQELVKEKNERMKIQGELTAIKQEKTTLKKELRIIVNRKIKLDEKMDALQKDQVSLRDRLAEMEIILKDKTSYIEDLKKQIESVKVIPVPERKESVELPTIVVRPQEGASTEATQPEKEIKIIAINRENGFVIIDAGAERGIKVGDALHVYRDNKPIATLEAIQTRPDLAACDIKQEIIPIAVGDMIK